MQFQFVTISRYHPGPWRQFGGGRGWGAKLSARSADSGPGGGVVSVENQNALVVELEFRCLPGGLVLDRNRSLEPFPRGGIEAFELEGVRVVVFGPVESGPVANVFGIVEWTK